MKRGMVLSIALGLSIAVVALMSSDRAATAAPAEKFTVDSGLVTLKPNQELRMTVANGLDTATVRFRALQYGFYTCSGGTCETQILSQTQSNQITLAPGNGLSFHLDDAGTQEVRGVVTSNINLRVTVSVVDTTTNQITWTFVDGG